MAAGLPVILSDQVGIAPEVLDEGRNGGPVRAGSAEELRDALQSCLERKAELPAMGRCASARLGDNYSCRYAATQFTRAVEMAIRP